MNRRTNLIICGCLLAGSTGLPLARCQDAKGTELSFELIGHVANSGPNSIQYGYLNFVNGIPRISTDPAVVNEGTAVFTFFNDTTNERVINVGPMRIVDRTGTGGIYFAPGGRGNFDAPDSFRSGSAVLLFKIRHQVVLDTTSGSFVTTFDNTITDVRLFDWENVTYRLGANGEKFKITVYGRLTQTGPPSAHIGGFASGKLAEQLQ